MAAAGALTLPTLDPAIEYLQGLGDPTVELRLARLLDADADLGMLRARVGVCGEVPTPAQYVLRFQGIVASPSTRVVDVLLWR